MSAAGGMEWLLAHGLQATLCFSVAVAALHHWLDFRQLKVRCCVVGSKSSTSWLHQQGGR